MGYNHGKSYHDAYVANSLFLLGDMFDIANSLSLLRDMFDIANSLFLLGELGVF